MTGEMEKEQDATVASEGGGPSLFIRVIFVLAIIAAGLGLLIHCVQYLGFGYTLDDGEGFVLNQAKIISQGWSPYPPIDAKPFIVTNYPPLFITLLALLVKVFGVKLTLGRFVSFFSGIAILYLVYLACNGGKFNRAGISGFLGPALLAASPVMYFWMPLCRIDIFANFLSLAAVYAAWRYKDDKRLYRSLPLLWAALFTRQSSVEGLIVISIYLFLRRRHDFWRYLILYIAGAAVLSAICYIAFGPEFFRHVVIYTKTKWYAVRLIATFDVVFKGMFLPTAVAVFAAWQLRKNREASIWIYYFIVGFLMALLAGKVGSDQNYFLPIFIPQAIVTGIWAAEVLNSPGHWKAKNGLLMLISGLVLFMGFVIGDRVLSFTPSKAAAYNGQQLVEIIRSFKGPVLVEDEGLTLLAGREVIYNPFIMNELNKEGLWDQKPFVESIRNAEYELIVLRFNVFDKNHEDTAELGDMAGWDRFSPEMEEAIRENYVTDGVPLPMRRLWYFYTRKSEGPPKVRLVFEEEGQ